MNDKSLFICTTAVGDDTKSLADLFEEWDNPVFSVPEQVLFLKLFLHMCFISVKSVFDEF